jgi:hypothetical protein
MMTSTRRSWTPALVAFLAAVTLVWNRPELGAALVAGLSLAMLGLMRTLDQRSDEARRWRWEAAKVEAARLNRAERQAA